MSTQGGGKRRRIATTVTREPSPDPDLASHDTANSCSDTEQERERSRSTSPGPAAVTFRPQVQCSQDARLLRCPVSVQTVCMLQGVLVIRAHEAGEDMSGLYCSVREMGCEVCVCVWCTHPCTKLIV